MQLAFVDTSAWYALIDIRDPDHANVLNALKSYEHRLVTSNYVFDETLTLLRYRLGWQPAHEFGQSGRAGELAKLIRIEAKDETTAWQIFCDYADKSFSFTDCTSFALMRRLRLEIAITVDQNFRTFGLHCIP